MYQPLGPRKFLRHFGILEKRIYPVMGVNKGTIVGHCPSPVITRQPALERLLSNGIVDLSIYDAERGTMSDLYRQDLIPGMAFVCAN